MVYLGNSWDKVLYDEFQKDYYMKLREFLKNEYKNFKVYPPMDEIFTAFKVTPYEEVKVLILGQDPYHGYGQAHGMAFSVKPGIKQPPSVVNIFKELKDDLEIEPPPKDNGYLMPWAQQGVMMLNTCLTVREHQPESHKGKGWEILTDRVIQLLSERDLPLVFILWGNHAKSKKPLINGKKHLILEGAHPSPFSAYNGFFGGRYFSKANAFLEENGMEPIDWSIGRESLRTDAADVVFI